MKRTADENNGLLAKLNMGNGLIQPKPVSQFYEFYITGTIEEPSEYIAWFDLIRHADETDIIKIYINSYGGDLFTAIQFMRVLAETKATTIASVEGACMSAATMIFLCCGQYEVTPHSVFMFHNYSGGTIGKGGEMIDQLLHERQWSQNLMKEVYKDFLTEEEIDNMLNNRDYWMSGTEVVERLNVRASKYLEALEKKSKTSTRATPKKSSSGASKKPPVKKSKPQNSKNITT